MNWPGLAVALVLPVGIALPVAALFWRRKQIDLGNVFGAGIFLLAAVILAGNDYAAALAYRMGCEVAELPCPLPVPSDFVKLSAYGIVAFIQVGALYAVSMKVDRWIRRRDYSPEWR